MRRIVFTVRRRLGLLCALGIGLGACQPKAPPIDQAALRQHLAKSFMDSPSSVVESLRRRGFVCAESRMAWVKTGTGIGCSARNAGNFLNVELAVAPSGTRLGSYRIYETPQPLYGGTRPK